MTENQFPYEAWVLTAGFAPKKVEIVGIYSSDGWMRAQSRKTYHQVDLFTSKERAIEAGWRRLDEQWSALQKRADAIAKKRAMLTKHSAKP
jgi:ribonuclease HI